MALAHTSGLERVGKPRRSVGKPCEGVVAPHPGVIDVGNGEPVGSLVGHGIENVEGEIEGLWRIQREDTQELVVAGKGELIHDVVNPRDQS